MSPIPKAISSATVLLSLTCVSACAPTRTPPPTPTPNAAATEHLVVISQPPGALIVVRGDTLAPAPITFRLERPTIHGIRDELYVLAVPSDSGSCAQHRFIRYHQELPDTVRFDMHRCPPRHQDFTRVFEDSEVTTPPKRVSSPPVRYPDVLRQIDARGAVVLEAVIDTTGLPEPRTIRVLFATHQSLFEGPAQEILRLSRFEPGSVYDQKVRARARVTIHFSPERVY